MKTFIINAEYIQLIQLLKAARIAQSGGEAQAFVEDGLVTVNGNSESRKRAKLRDGDIVRCNNISIHIKNK